MMQRFLHSWWILLTAFLAGGVVGWLVDDITKALPLGFLVGIALGRVCRAYGMGGRS